MNGPAYPRDRVEAVLVEVDLPQNHPGLPDVLTQYGIDLILER